LTNPVCVPSGQVGLAGECVGDADCKGNGSIAVCAGEVYHMTCMAIAHAGDPCDEDLGQCDAATRCLPTGRLYDFTCQPPLGQGEECMKHDDCGTGLGCMSSSSDPTRTCEPLRAEGEPCAEYGDCQKGFECDDFKVPSDIGTCMRID
jgi:hypothetical protein